VAVIDHRSTGAHDSVLEVKPGKHAAEGEKREIIDCFQVRSNFKDHGKNKSVTDKEYQRVDDCPKEPHERANVSSLQITLDKIPNQVPLQQDLPEKIGRDDGKPEIGDTHLAS